MDKERSAGGGTGDDHEEGDPDGEAEEGEPDEEGATEGADGAGKQHKQEEKETRMVH